jgi:RNA recognition motif-containing protein
LNGEEIYGMKIRISLFVDASKRNLYFKHLPKDITKDDCEALVGSELSQFGDVESLKIETDENKRYYGFVCYTTLAAAQNAYLQLNREPIKIEGCDDEFFINWTETQHHKLNLHVRNLNP